MEIGNYKGRQFEMVQQDTTELPYLEAHMLCSDLVGYFIGKRVLTGREKKSKTGTFYKTKNGAFLLVQMF